MLNTSFANFYRNASPNLLLEDSDGVIKHLNHLEELILTSKQQGLDMALSFLRELYEIFKGKADSTLLVSVKFDGAPACIVGLNPENDQFFVSTKSIGNVNPKINYTDSDVDRNHGHAPDLAKKLKLALKYLPAVIKDGVYQGDFLFDQQDLKTQNIDGEDLLTFKPNTITYAIPVNTPLSQRVLRSKIGIVFHTRFTGPTLQELSKSSDVNVTEFNKTADVFVDDATFKDVSGRASFTSHESKKLEELLNAAETTGNKVKWSEVNDEVYGFLNTFINNLIRQGEFVNDPHKDFDKFIAWITSKKENEIEKLKTENGKAKKRQALNVLTSSLEASKLTLLNLFILTKKLEEAKMMFVYKYNSAIRTKQFITDESGNLQVTAPEGYVAVDHHGNMVKLINRLQFSKANFSVSKEDKFSKQDTSESQEKFVILLPGGYKPPTKGHMHMIEEYNNNPLVHKIIVLIGPKEREGYTRETSLKLFDLYGINSLQKVVMEDTKHDNPMVAGFDFVEKDPRAENYKGFAFGFGASNKGDDADRAERLVKYFAKNPKKLREGLEVEIPPIIKALESDNIPISATNLRKAIQKKDIKAISELIPARVNPNDFLKIVNK